VRLQRLALAAGLALFLWLLHRIGLGVVAASLARIGWGFAAVLGLEAAVVLSTTLGWRWTLPPDRRVPAGALVAMRIAGDGVNALAPAAVVGGELTRAGLLSRFLPGAEALSSVGLAAMAQFLAQVLFVGLGATILPGAGLQPRLRVLGLCLLAFVAVFAAALHRLSRKGGAAPGRLRRLFERLAIGLARRFGREEFWRDLERQVFGFVRRRPGRLALSVLFFFLGWSVGIAEVALVLALLGSPMGVGTAFSIAVLAVLVEGALFFVPSRVGVQEGGFYAIFAALGLDPVQGFTLGLVRRLRELTWGLVGLMILGFFRRRIGNAPAAEIRMTSPEPALPSRPASP
jgi:glycosyltransferase 2 family protein